MLASGRVEELIGTSTTYRVVVADVPAGIRLLEAAGHGVRVEDPVLVVDTPGPPEAITRTLADGGVYLAELVPVRADLESVFLQLTEESTLGHGRDLGAKEVVR
jgi:ABC-2 type transport system ATP-binding protein